jgi:cytochrome c oxidase subunit 2
MFNFNVYKFFNDAPEAWQFGFQDSATAVASGMINFHNFLMMNLLVIGTIVLYVIIIVILRSTDKNSSITWQENFSHSEKLEVIWTIIPAIILLGIASPSFTLLYSLDESMDPDLSLKVIGHQWYWSYEYSDLFFNGETGDYTEDLAFDSYMIPQEDLEVGQLRLLEVDNRVNLPANTHIRLLVTSADVLHSWAVPSFGIKVDACPGRLSQASLFIEKEGVYYGQCSEICGINHGFMPIVVNAQQYDSFLSWKSIAE